MNTQKIAAGTTETHVQDLMRKHLNKEIKDALFALAVSWEETGKHSISNRIRTTMNFCAKELKDFIQNENA